MPPESGVAPKGKSLVALPTGTVTFLFTDIEGSTQRWEAHREAMKAALARHEQLMSAAIAHHDGYVFKIMGDAFCATFHTAAQALGAAIEAQLSLAKEDFSSVAGLRVRMGLHAGEADERDGDYFGPAVNRVARLMSIGHGGQVLLSSAVREMAEDALPEGTSFVDLGLRRLKDLTLPEQVWQLIIAGLPAEFPPLNSLDARANNLPIALTNLLGRERELEEVKTLASGHRLLTLSGAGGIGKTRLALQAAADLIDRYAAGVWFADLAPLSDPELVASVTAKVVGMVQVEGRRVDEALPHWLKRKQLLLILDNCEHVIEAVAGLAVAILGVAPHVHILATSRQALGIAGEFVFRLPSLGLPEATAGLTVQNVLTYGAIALFVDRATASDARFVLSDDNAPIVAEICRRLDGIPLAIELAAARVKVLSIPNLAQRLNDRFKILTGGSRTALPRQKTLTALIEWSYGLLTPQEQMLFNRLAIFAGGFSLNAAMVVCAGDDIDESDVFDLVSSLTDKSLVVAETGGEQERYRLLESTRAYALEKLAAAREGERLSRRHGEYFRNEAQAADLRYRKGSTAGWLVRVELELDNYRTVLEWALTDGNDAALGGAVAGALDYLWSIGGLEAEGRYWIGRAQAGLDETAHPLVAARLWLALTHLSYGKRMHVAAERALELYQSVGDGRGAAWALRRLGHSLYQMGRLEEANEQIERALVAMRECGDTWGAANCLLHQADIQWSRGYVVAARELYANALEAFKALGDEDSTAGLLGNFAELEFADGHAEEALRLAIDALEIRTRGKDARSFASGYNNSTAYRIALADMDGARETVRQGLRWARQAQSVLYIAIALQHFALLAALCGQAHTAGRLIGYVNLQCKEIGLAREPTEKWGYEKLMLALREQLSEAEIEKLAAEGAMWSEDQAVEEALKS